MAPRKHLRKIIIALYALAVLGFSVFSRAESQSMYLGTVYATPDGYLFQVEGINEDEGPVFLLESEQDLSFLNQVRVLIVGIEDTVMHKVGPWYAPQALDPLSNERGSQAVAPVLKVLQVTEAL